MAANIGSRIAELRGAHGLSQEALANELGLSRQAVSRWERGEALPDTENLIALADLFEVTLDELVRPERGHVETDERAQETPGTDSDQGEGVSEPDASSVEDMAPTLVQPAVEPEADDAKQGEPEGDDPPTIRVLPGRAKRRWFVLALVLGIALPLVLFGSIVGLTYLYHSFAFGNASQTGDLGRAVSADVFIDGAQVTDIAIGPWIYGTVHVQPVDDLETEGCVRLLDETDPGDDPRKTLVWQLKDGMLSIEADGSHPGAHDLTIFVPVAVMDHLRQVTIDAESAVELTGLTCGSLKAKVGAGYLDSSGMECSSVDLSLAGNMATISGAIDKLDVTIARGGQAYVECHKDPATVDATVNEGALVLNLNESCGFTLTGDPDPTTLDHDQLEVEFPLVHDGKASVHGDGKTQINANVTDGRLVIAEIG